MNKSDEDTNTMGRSNSNLSKCGENPVYIDFYSLREPPFSITPDPEFLFLSNTHKSVIDKILYGIDNKMGFILLIGEAGTGKATGTLDDAFSRLGDYYDGEGLRNAQPIIVTIGVRTEYLSRPPPN